MNLLQLLLKLVLKLVEPILGIFRSQSSNRNRQNSSEPKPVRGFRSIFVSDSSNRNEQNPSYSQLKTPRPSGQTFILEPMLTPSGLLDGGDDSSDGLDGSDVADIELPAELDPEPTSDETGEVNGTEVEDAESEDLEEIGFAQNEETTTGEAQTEEEVPFAEEGSDDATGESQQDLNNSTESATDETSQELGTSQTEEQANTSESEGEVEESSETTVSETTDTEESDTGAEVIDEQANSSETTDTESDAADEEMNASETESSEVEDENADEGESLTEETTDVPDTSETETADTDNESADDGEAVAETTSSTQENQDRDSEEQSTSESESPANSDESVETDSVVENGAEITIGSDESFSEDTEATSENELEAETTEPDESVVTDEADSEEPDDSTEETVSDSVASVHNENELSFDSGIFVVGENGKVSVDFLFDGGSYRGELGMFSLAGMDEFDPNSEEFIREAARRSLSDSTLGHVVISDRSEGARFTAELDEGNWNSGEYRGVQTFTMRPEDEFAVMLVPQGSVEQVFDNPWSGGARRPLFSLATANPSDTFHVGQIVDVVGDGSTFAMEDLRADSWTDRDYNDIIFQFRGARGSAQQIDTLISDRHDWRDTDFGRGLYDYVRPYEVREDIDRPETDGVNSSTDNVEKNSDDNSSLSSKNDAEEVTEDEIEDNSSTEEGNPQNTNYDSDSTHRDRPETESNLDSETEPETSDSSDDFQDDGNDIDVDDHPDEDSHLESETSNDLDSTIADNFSTGETEERDSQTPTDRSNPEDRDRTETASNLDSNTDRVETSHSSDNTHNEDSEVDRSDRPDRNSNSEAETGNHLERPIADNSSTEATEAGDSQTAIDDTDSVNRDRPSETPVSSNPNQSEPNPPGSELNDTSTEVNSPATTPSATETQSNHLPSSEPSSDSTEPHPSSPDSTVNLAERIDTSQGDRTVVGLVGQGADPQHPALQDRVVVSGEDRIDGDNNSFVASDEGQHDNEILNIFNTPDHRNPIWFSRAVGSGEWTDSIVEFVDTLQDSGQSRGVLNLSFDLVQINDNGNIETRYEFTPDERAAIEFARQHGVLIVASAGNDGAAMSILGQASQEFDNIVTVGAAQENNPTATPALAFDRAESSSYGYGLDLVAPGDRADGSEMGSSLATARVTEAVSRVWDANPDLNYRQIVEILKRTATDLRDPNWDPHTGAGLLNVAAAINFAKAIDAQTYAVPEIEPTETWSGAGQVRPSERPTDANGDRPEGSSTQTTEIDTSFRRPYVVRPGDTLWTIAQRELDSGYRWREIQAADGSYFAVEDNDRLSVGTTVYLPVIYLRNTGLDIPLYSPDAEFELQVSSFQTEGESIPLTALVEPQFKRNLDRIELNLKPDGGDWQDLPDLTDFTINDQGQIVFETELPPSDIGHYQIEAIAYDNNGNEIDRHNSNFAVTSSPDLDGYGFDLPDPVRMGIIQSADLSSYDTANIATAREWVIGIPPSESADAIASDLADLGASNAGATDIIPSTYTLSFPEGTDPTKIAARVSQQDSVKFFYPLVLYDLKSQDAEWRHNQRLVDGELWHLPKAKVTEAWDTGLPWNSKQSVSGDRVNIGVVDDGVDFRHPDLAGNYREDLSKDFNGNPPDSFDPAQFLADLPEGWWEEFQAKLHNPELAREDLENSELRQDEQWWSMYWSWLNGEDITLTENWWGMYWSWLSASASLNWDEQWWGMYWSWLNVSDPVETDEQWWRMYWSWLSESEMAVDEQWWGMYWSWLSESDYSVDPQWWSMYWSWLNDSELGSYVELSDQWWGMYWSWLSDRAEGNASWQNLSPDDLNLAADEQWWGMYWSWLSDPNLEFDEQWWGMYWSWLSDPTNQLDEQWWGMYWSWLSESELAFNEQWWGMYWSWLADPNLEFDEQWWGMYWSWLANSDLAFNEQWWGMYWSWLSSASYETNAQWWGMYWSWLDDSASTALQEQWWGMYWSWLSEVSIDEQWWGMYWSWLSDAVLDSQLDLQEQWWQMYWSWLDDSSVEVDEQWWGMYWSWLNGGEPSINEQWWGMYWSWLNGQSPGLGVQSEGLSLLDSGLTPQDSNQTRPDFLHGTAVSGIAAANGDREGVVGAAPDANLASLRLLANNVTDFTIASALTHENDEIDLYNNSWKAGSLIAPPMSLMALHLGASQGRAGLGSNQIFAGGNDGNRRERSDYNAFANSRHTISVAANDYTGQQSTTYRDGEFSWASEPGASLLVTSPSSGNHRGVTTTDITTGGYSSGNAEDGGYYTDRFGGTSAAAPLVSGIVALMLEVNPNLTQRDIQHILVETANRDLISDPYVEWSGNAGDDLRHNDRYGFGAIDAEAAIQAAANWTPVDPEVLVSGSATIDRAIPDYNYKAEEPNSIASTISISEDIQVEWAEIVFDADHPYRGDLEVRLTSPDGTESVLAEMREDSRGNYKWVFTSARHWGESSLGDWTLTVTDQRSGSEGTWNNWKLNLYGTTEIPTDPWLQQLGTDGLDRFRGVAVDDLGYVYAAGSTQGAFDKDATARGEDAMVVKFDPDGRLMWAQQSETPGNDAYNHIAVDKKGYIYTIGSDSRGNETAVLLTKWNRQGDRVWAQTLDSAPDGTIEYDTEGADFGSSISTDGNGNIYIAGTTDRSIRNLGGTQDGFVAKYNPGGRLIWSDELDSNRDDAARSVFSDDLGNTYVVGVTDGNLGGDNAGDTDLFLRKYDVLGNEVWTRQIGSSAADGYFDEFDRDAVAAVDGEGNIYLVATTEGEFDGQSHAGGRDIAIAKYNADGDRVWTKQIGTDRDDRAWGVSVDRANTVYITGETRGNLNGHVNAGGWDAVTIALDGDGNHLVTETLATEADDRAFDIRIDSQGNVYQVGSTAGALTGSGTGNDDAWIVKNYIKPTVYLETLDGAAGEDGNVAQFAFKRSGNLEQPLTVRYDVAGDATPGADYRELSGTVTFPAGSAVAMLPTIALADAEVEADETVEVSIAPDATYQISGDRDRAVATISDNTGASTYGPFTYVNPDNGHVYLLSPPETWVGAQGYAESLSGHLVAIDDEAEDRWLNETFGSQQYFHIGLTDSELYGNQEDDYQWVNGQPLNYTNWQADEPNNVGEGEDFALNNWEEAGKWNDIANDVIEPGIIEIDPNQLDRPIVLITATDAKAGEDGNAGQLLITRIGNTDEALNVNYSVAGDAVNGVDYESLSGNVTIPEGESLVTIPIHVLSDRELEDPETIAIDLEAGDYNIGSLQTTTVEIADRHPINQIANAIIGRDVAKLEYWNDRWQNGETLEELRPAIIAEAYDGSGNSDAEMAIDAIYQDVLGRSATASEIATWRSRLETDTTLSQVRQELQGAEPIDTLNYVYIHPETGKRYVLSQPDTWLGAQEQAERLGGNLVAIDDASENQWLVNTLDPQHLWIGLTDSPLYGLSEGEFQWVSGASAEFTNWWSTVPDNVLFTPEGEDFTETNFYSEEAGLGVWNDLSSSWGIKPGIIELPAEPPTVTLSVTDAEASEDGDAGQFVVSRTGDINTPLTVRYNIAGDATNGVDYQDLDGTITIPAGSRQATLPVVANYDYDAEAEETVQLTLVEDDSTYQVDSDEDSGIVAIANSTQTSRYGPFVYVNPETGNLYVLSDNDTWLGAQEQAEALGGNLVTINDDRENTWLTDTFGNRDFWIGFTDSDVYGNREGEFEWVSGEASSYTNWLPTEPTGDGNSTEINFASETYGVGGWNDRSHDSKIQSGIIEVDPTSLDRPIVNVMVTDDRAGENGDAGHIVFTRVGNLNRDLTLSYSVAGDATNGSDYQSLSGEITIPAGKSLVELPIRAIPDNLDESEETVVVRLDEGDYERGTHKIGQIQIANSDTAFNPVVYTHPETGNRYFLTATDTWLGAQQQAQGLGGNLVSINDISENQWLIDTLGDVTSWIGLTDSPIYGFSEGEFQWVSEESAEFTNWWKKEPNNVGHTPEGEDFAETNHVLGHSWNDLPNGLRLRPGIVEVPADTPRVSLAVTDAEASEDGNAGQFVLTRTGEINTPLTVRYDIAGDAANGVDYQNLDSTITIPAGSRTVTIPVVAKHDYETEADETVRLTLVPDGGAYEIVANEDSGIVTIANSTQTSRYGSFVYVNPETGNLYITSEKDTWLGAQEQAEALGGNLVTINDDRENTWLTDTFGNRDFWIGFTDSDVYGNREGEFEWVSGEASSYTNWLPTEPTGDGNSTEINFASETYGVGGWNDRSHDSKIQSGIIEVDPTSLDRPIVNVMVTDDRAGENGDAGQIVIQRIGNIDRSLSVNYSLGGDATNGSDFQTLSGNIIIPAGETLVTLPIIPLPDDEIEGNETLVVNLAEGDYETGTHSSGHIIITDQNPINRLYQEVLERNAEPTGLAYWTNRWQNGESLTELRWLMAHDPFHTESVIKINQIYQDIEGRTATPEEMSYWRSRLGTDTSLSQVRQQIEGAEFIINTNNPVYTNPTTGNRYFLTTPDTWLGAQEQAQALGGNLVTVDNADENQWLFDTLGNGPKWIGLNDSPIYGNTEGNHQWMNGEATYTNWWPTEPNNASSVTPEGEDFSETNFGTPGLWNDMPSQQNFLRRGIVEIPAPIADNPWIRQYSYNWTRTHFGEDLHDGDNNTRLDATPQLDNARDRFLANLVNVETADLEGFASGDTPATLTLGNTTATLSGNLEVYDVPTATEGGTFPTSGDRYLLSSHDESFRIDFSDPQSAFGFNVTDSEGGPFVLTLHREDGTTEDLRIPVQADWPQNSGSALFFGVTDLETPFTAVTIHKPAASERLGIDDITVAQVNPDRPSLATPPNRTLYLAYTEDRALDLSDIVVSSPTDEATVTLTVSDPNAGTLTIPTSNNATATYDPQTGVWEASGNVADLNALLSEVQFVPRENAHGDLDIDLRVDADNRPSLHGTIALTGLAVNDPPQLSAIAPLSGATQHQPFTITYDDLLATSDATDVDGDEIAFTIDNLESGTLTKNGEPVELGETAIAPGEELVWTPDTFGDAVAAFTVTATDGQSSSPTPVAVAIATAESPISFHNPDRAYRSFDDSPFKYQPFRYFHLEDWESGQLDAPGMSLSGGAIASPSDPDAEVDSVDIDDGAIDGEGVQGRSWATDDNSLTLTFDEAELGSLPTHVGFALTQLTGTDNSIQLEAFDAQGNSLGVRDFDPLPPQGVDGETAQDRFFGIESDSGIASLQITANRPMSERLEIDHIQYGEIDPDAPPTLSETDTYYDDRYISGDWDGDGTDNIATVRDQAIAMDTDFDALPDLLHWFGDPHASQFLVGDWNGDGKDTVAYLKGNTVYIDFNRDGNIDESRQFGIGTQADEYLVGDWNADGIEELAYRVGNTIYFDTDGDLELTFGDENTQIDRYWTADWNGDGQDDIAYRIGDTIYIDTDLDGEADRTIADLGNEDGYLVGDWDGDGTDEFAVRRGDSIWTNPDADTPLQRFGYGTNGDRYTYWNSRMLSGTRLYLENESLPLGDRYVYDFNQNLQLQTSELQIGDRDPNETVTVRLSLSDASAGHLISGAIDNTTATYDSDTGVWTAQGSVEAINQLLQTVEFEPTPGYNDNLIVTASVSDETSETAMGSLALFGQSTNDTPTVTTSNVILTDATESAPYTITYEDLVAATGTTDADGDTLSFRIESVGADIPTKDGEPVDPGVTSLSPGEAIVWTPTTAGQGQLAFTATVSDGEVTAETPIEVSLDVNPITVSLEATDPDATEGSDPGEFTFTRTGDTTNPMTVNFTIEPSINWGRPQAGNGTDYETIPTSITIPEGESSVTLTITSLEDTETEWPETVRLQLDEGEGYEINSSEHLDTVVIWDNETPKLRLYGKWYSGQPENFHQASYTSESGNNETFLLRRIGSLEEDLTVYYSLPGTATNGEDYEELPGSITIPAGQRDITFAMTIIDDDEIEGDETVELTLTPDPTYTFMNHAGRIWDRIPVTIVDNDDKPTVEITVSDNQASEYGDPGQFTISRTGDTSNPLTVDYWISTGWWHKAKNGIDYEAIPESITIPAGESSITIDINPIDDSELEEDEIVDIYLKSNPNYAMSGTYYAKLKILDNETQSLQWQQQFGTSGEDIANSTATDSAGNTYTAGHTSGDLGGTSIGGDDAFIVKRDSSGNEQWRLQLGTTQDDSAKQIAVDRADNLYVLGWSDDPSNSWIAKYDSNGNQQWQKPLGDDGYDITNGALTLGDDGSLYITGRTTGDLDGTNQGETDAWVAKYDSEGNPQWRQQFGTPHADEALAVAVDGNDNVFLTGYTQGALAGTREGDGDVWVAMYEPINNSQQTQLAWKTQLGTQSKDVATSIAVDNNGRVYIGGQTFGWFGETYDGDADDWVGDRQAWWDAIHGDRSGLGGTYYGNGDAWVAQLNSNDGSSNWKRLLGTEEADNLTTVVTDELGNVYLSGMTEGKLGDSQFGGKDVYLVKYDVKGALQWKKQFGSDGEDDVGDLILTDTGIFLTGNTSADFGGSNQGGKDGWLTKLS